MSAMRRSILIMAMLALELSGMATASGTCPPPSALEPCTALVRANTASLEAEKRRRIAFDLDQRRDASGRALRLRVHYSGVVQDGPDAVLSIFASDRDAVLDFKSSRQDVIESNRIWIEDLGFAVVEPPAKVEIRHKIAEIELETALAVVELIEQELKLVKVFDDPCISTHPPTYTVETPLLCGRLSYLDRRDHPHEWLAELLYDLQAYVEIPSEARKAAVERLLKR